MTNNGVFVLALNKNFIWYSWKQRRSKRRGTVVDGEKGCLADEKFIWKGCFCENCC